MLQYSKTHIAAVLVFLTAVVVIVCVVAIICEARLDVGCQ